METHVARALGKPILDSATLARLDVLERWEYAGLSDYFAQTLRKIEKARAQYGMDYLGRDDASFVANVSEELLDVSGWAAMRHIKLARSNPPVK